MKKLIVDKKYDGKKLNKFLLDTFSMLNINTIYKALRKKDILVNNIRVHENIDLHENDNITIYIKDELLYPKIDKVYEDINMVVVNKPIGIEEEEVTKMLRYYPCHRLDRNTSGIMLYAKNENTLNYILKKFENHEVEKKYVCIVYGILPEKSKTIQAYLFKDAKKSLVYISDTPKKGYAQIITSYKVLKEDKKRNISLLDIGLETGRTHQIRAHLAHIGFPIIGDGKYGENEINKKFKQKTQLLMAYKLCLDEKTFEISYEKIDFLM